MKHKSGIKGKVMAMAGICFLVITCLFLVVYIAEWKNVRDNKKISQNREVVVALNEIEMILGGNVTDDIVDDETVVSSDMTTVGTTGNAMTNASITQALAKIDELSAKLSSSSQEEDKANLSLILVFYVASVLSLFIVFAMVYVLVLRPFSKLENFAGELSKGNLDEELKYQRVNVFGEFTWAFDHMRREIKRARQCEQEAVENNKTVIATLSHDIKTPIASIRAYSEALLENMDSTPERRQRYIDVIMRKCDEVTKITNDMFIHSLHDLDKLIIKKEDVEIHSIITETVESMQGNKADVVFGDIKEATLTGCDRERIAQIIENLINNARKYAPGEIFINTDIVDEVGNSYDELDSLDKSYMNRNAIQQELQYVISIKDTGNGIPDQDMPFIFDKFYRGKNHGDQPGSGLGLFIVKYIMEQMGGKVTITNHKDGMEVKLFFVYDKTKY